MTKITRKIYTTRKDLEDSSPKELTELLVRKAQTNPEGWTAQAAVDVNISFLDERKELRRVHRSGRPKGALGVARAVVERLAPKCDSFDALLLAMKHEKGAKGPVLDFEDDGSVIFLDEAKREHPISRKALKDYFREAKRRK